MRRPATQLFEIGYDNSGTRRWDLIYGWRPPLTGRGRCYLFTTEQNCTDWDIEYDVSSLVHESLLHSPDVDIHHPMIHSRFARFHNTPSKDTFARCHNPPSKDKFARLMSPSTICCLIVYLPSKDTFARCHHPPFMDIHNLCISCRNKRQ